MAAILKRTCILMLLLLLAACSPGTRLAKLQGKHPAQVAAACALYYPTKDSISIKTEYLPGKETIKPGPVQYVDCDSAVATAGAGNAKQVPCPPADTIYRVDTFYSNTFLQQEGTAGITAAQAAEKKATAAQIKAESGRGTWRLIALVLAAYTLARLILKYYFKLNFLP